MRRLWPAAVAAMLMTGARGALAAPPDKFPSVVTVEADLSEGDVEHARQDARADALKGVVRAALQSEIGKAAVEEDQVETRLKFINPYADFFKRSAIVSERKTGPRLAITVGYEFDYEKFKLRLAAARFSVAEPKPRIALLWQVEERPWGADDVAKDPKGVWLRSASWMAAATAPIAIQTLADELAANGFVVSPVTEPVRRWFETSLPAQGVTQDLLAELGNRTLSRTVLFVKIVRRRVPPLPASHLQFTRVNQVAFTFDVVKKEFTGKPVATPVVELSGIETEAAAYETGDWAGRVLETLLSAPEPRVKITVRGISDPAAFDEILRRIRKIEKLRDAVPWRIGADACEFVVAGETDPAPLVKALAEGFDPATVSATPEGITIVIKAARH